MKSTRGHSRQTPGSRSKSVALLRQQLIKAREYGAKQDDEEPGARDLGLEMLAEILAGDRPLIVEVHKHSDIMTALRPGRGISIFG